MENIPIIQRTNIEEQQVMTPDGQVVTVGEEVSYSEPAVFQFLDIPNIASMLTEEKLLDIGRKVNSGFESDRNTRSHREHKMKQAIDCAMQVIIEKQYPWPKASNVKYPLLTVSSIEFAARVSAAIIQDGNIVKGKVWGRDEITVPIIDPTTGQPAVNPETGEPQMQVQTLGKQARADRMSEYMNYQLTEKMKGWEDDMDKMFHILPIVGCMFKKTYYDPSCSAPESRYIFPNNIFMRYDTRSVEKAIRITHAIDMTKNEIVEKQRLGVFLDIDVGLGDGGVEKTIHQDKQITSGWGDDNQFYTILEQHCWLDLDGDGYQEPYVVTVLKNNSKVLRIFPRYTRNDVEINDLQQVVKIKPICYFTKYGFIPAMDGGFYDIGFGEILYPLNAAIDTTVNSLIDAGHLANVGGGLIGGNIRIKAGALRLNPGEYKVVNNFGGSLRDNIVELNTKEPSSVLFQLLQYLVEAGNGVGISIKDLIKDSLPANAPATTTIAYIENGLSVFKGIYKRIHRALKEELKKIAYVNYVYLTDEEYQRVLDDPQATTSDFAYEDCDVVPVSDPSVVTDMQRMAKVQALLDFKDDPMMNGLEIRERALKEMGYERIETLFAPPPPPQDPMEAQLLQQNAMLDLQLKQGQVDLMSEQITDAQKHRQIQAAEAQGKIEKDRADAESVQIKTQTDKQKLVLDAQKQQADIMKEPTSGAMVTAFVEMSKSVRRGEITANDAQNALMLFFGLSREQAMTFFDEGTEQTLVTETPAQELMQGIENEETTEPGVAGIDTGDMGPVETPPDNESVL